MKTHRSALLRLAAAVALIASSGTARAVLLDHGPGDPTLIWPTWYRDMNLLALQLCKSQTNSPNGIVAPMCFPLAADPGGFPGNLGMEIFYNNFTVRVQKGNPNFAMKYVAALEASYATSGVPTHGDEAVFARIRVVIHTQMPGVYTVTHPFGVEVFNVTPADLGPRAVFFTADVPLGVPLDFDTSLTGRVGPFLQWDFVDPGFTLDVVNSAGVTESFVGDPSFDHTITGSPFGTNYVRVDGPPGSNLDGAGSDFIQTPLGTVLGQKWTAPIPTPLTIKRATYSRDPATNVTGIDVYARSVPGSQMILTGAGMPSVQMTGDAAGNYFSHVEIPATAIPPASVSVTNATSNPQSTRSEGLVDLVNITGATFDTLTRNLSVTATSSDKSSPPPALAVDVAGIGASLMTAGSFTLALPAGVLPPLKVSVASSAGGTDSDDVVILPGLTDAKPYPPVAVADAFITNENVAATIDLGANDSVTPPAAPYQVVIVSQPTSGTVSPLGINTASVTYTPSLNYWGADSFSYVLIDTAGAVSNVATVAMTVNFVPASPKANADDFAMVVSTATAPKSRTFNVLANDVATPGTALAPASLAITTLPLHGNVVVNLDGTVTYKPLNNYLGGDSFQYTVANNFGIVSAPATVYVVVFSSAEQLSYQKITYVSGKQQWTIVGSTTWFGPTLTHTTVSCYIGSTVGGASLGSVGVDTTGKFQLVPVAGTVPPPDATKLITCQSSNGGIKVGVATIN
jgi:hypothetical protein